MSAIVTVHDTPAPPPSGVKALGMVPPHDLDAESAVLAAVLVHGQLPAVAEFLRPEHFYSESHRRIYEATVALTDEGTTVDVVTVAARLKETKRLAQVGGTAYIASILDSTPAPRNVRAHAEVVFERWRVRQVMVLCEQASAYGHGVVDAQKYADSVIHALAVVARNRPGEKPDSNFEVLRRIARTSYEVARGIESDAPKKGPALLTGIRVYDEHLGGLYAGQKTSIVALPRVGKTALALQIAINVAKLGVAVAFFSTEMDHEELGDRQLAQLARIDSRRLRLSRQKAILEADEWSRLTMAVNDESNAFKLHVFDDGSPTVDDICAGAKNLSEQSLAVDGVPLGLVVVDYVQRLAPAPSVSNKSKPEQITYATKRLKNLAKELKLPVLELAQQKVLEKDRAGKRATPTLGDEQWCSAIGQESHNVLYLYRPSERDGANVRLACVKQRGGEEFDEPLLFERAYSRFADPGPGYPVSRQYLDLEPPAGRFDDDAPDLLPEAP